MSMDGILSGVLRRVLRRNSTIGGATLGGVVVAPIEDAPDFARKTNAGLMVSIADPERREFVRGRIRGAGKWKLCELDFHDIDRAAPGLVEPQEVHVLMALAASMQVPLDRNVVVHCQAGVSRSSAIALLLEIDRRRRFGVPDEEAVRLAVDEMKAYMRHVRPNQEVVRIGAEYLCLPPGVLEKEVWEKLHCR